MAKGAAQETFKIQGAHSGGVSTAGNMTMEKDVGSAKLKNSDIILNFCYTYKNFSYIIEDTDGGTRDRSHSELLSACDAGGNCSRIDRLYDRRTITKNDSFGRKYTEPVLMRTESLAAPICPMRWVQ